MDWLVEKLEAVCDCVEDITTDDVAELVNIVSLASCWTRKPCETFLKSDRREVIDLPSCASCPITFEPYYKPFDVSTFTFKVVKTEGLNETITEVPAEKFKYHETDEAFYIDPSLPDCKCQSRTCGCGAKYRLVIEYKAGYDETNFPDCMLPVLCNVLTVLKAKNNCDCEGECGCDTEQKVKYASGDVVSVALETDIGKMLVSQYKSQLGMISLCEGVDCSDIWGFVV